MPLNSTGTYFGAALLIGSGVGLLYLILRRHSPPRPEGALEWIGATLALSVVLMGGGIAALTLAGSSNGEEKSPSVTGTEAPRLRFRLADSNEPKTLRDYRGQVVLLNLWATWCPPCLDELPQLNRLQKTHGSQGLVVVTISDERRSTIRRFEREKLQLNTVSGYLPQDRSWPAPYNRVRQSRPYSFVIGPEGIIRDFWSGAGDYSTFVEAVRPYLVNPVSSDKPSPRKDAQ